MAKKTKSPYVLLAEHVDHEYHMPGSYDEDTHVVKYFKLLLTEEQAKLAAQISRTPMPAELIAKDLGSYDIEKLDEELLELGNKGILYYESASNGKRFYHIPNWAPGIVEYMVGNMHIPGVAECFDEYSQASGGEVMMMSPNGGGMRVIPVMKEIAAQPRALSYEQVLKYLDQEFYAPDDVNHEHPLPPLYSLADCACRTSKKMIGEGCEHPIEDMCIQIGPEAEYYIKSGKGREATREEVLEVLQRAEETGCVHEIFEFSFAERPVGESVFICNCCGCSCGVLSGNFKFGGNGGTHSNYLPEVNPEKCVACGACVEKCPANAIRLGDRLCVDAERQVDIYETAENYKWGEEKWNLNYRDRHMTTDSGTAPCKTYCPAHIAVQGYIRKASEGDYAGALEVIKRENPFPAVCGRVCNHPCESECSRSTVDEAVAIDEIKRFIAEQDLEASTRFIPEIKEHHDKKIAVIGAGPSGLTAAYYLAVKGYPVTVFEKEDDLGGMMIRGIPSFRLDKEVVRAEIDIIKELGVEFKTGVEVGKDVTIPELREQGYKAFYVAIGLQNGGRLGVPGDDAEGVISGIDYSVANTKSPQKLSGNVVVIGGGMIAADVARTAVRNGASKVHLYCLESYDEMPMGYGDRTECEAEGIEIHAGWGQTEVLSENGKVTGIKFRKCTSVRNAQGRFDPKFDDSVTETQDCTTVLFCIGQKVDWGELLKGTKVEFAPNGMARADELTRQTAEPDIFVGGDAYTGQKFVIDAIAGGKQGAESCWRYVEGLNLTYFRQREYHELDKDLLRKQSFNTIPRQVPVSEDAAACEVLTFEDRSHGLTEEQVQKEVDRCLGCGRAIVDTKKCIGCGVCTVQCEFDAIHLKFDHEHTPPKTRMGWIGHLAGHVVTRGVRVTANQIGKRFGADPVSREKKAREQSN